MSRTVFLIAGIIAVVLGICLYLAAPWLADHSFVNKRIKTEGDRRADIQGRRIGAGLLFVVGLMAVSIAVGR